MLQNQDLDCPGLVGRPDHSENRHVTKIRHLKMEQVIALLIEGVRMMKRLDVRKCIFKPFCVSNVLFGIYILWTL